MGIKLRFNLRYVGVPNSVALCMIQKNPGTASPFPPYFSSSPYIENKRIPVVIKEELKRLVRTRCQFIIVWYEDRESLVYHYWRVR
jgi:hypothetical protein